MELFEAKKLIEKSGLIVFSAEATDFLSDFVGALESDDTFTKHFRANLGCVAAAEFAAWRHISRDTLRFTSGPFGRVTRPLGPSIFPLEVRRKDAQLGILTADSIRTFECQTARRMQAGGYSAGDLFMLSGDANKVEQILLARGYDISNIESPEDFVMLWRSVYSLRENSWESKNLGGLVDSEFEGLSLVLGIARLAVARNWDSVQIEKSLGQLQKVAGEARRLEFTEGSVAEGSVEEV
jgi:hypothetical protein